jgi:Zn ribbon nucleic-acid-binding protein
MARLADAKSRSSVVPPVHDFTDPRVEQFTAEESCHNNGMMSYRPRPQQYVGPDGDVISGAEANVHRARLGLPPLDLSNEPVPVPDCTFHGEVTVVRNHGVDYWTCPQCGYGNARTASGVTPREEADQKREVVATKARMSREAWQKKWVIPWVVLGVIVWLVAGNNRAGAGWTIWFFTAAALFAHFGWGGDVYQHRGRSPRELLMRAGYLLVCAVIAAIGGSVLPIIVFGLLGAPTP